LRWPSESRLICMLFMLEPIQSIPPSWPLCRAWGIGIPWPVAASLVPGFLTNSLRRIWMIASVSQSYAAGSGWEKKGPGVVVCPGFLRSMGFSVMARGRGARAGGWV
jgi:hypothetical protein